MNRKYKVTITVEEDGQDPFTIVAESDNIEIGDSTGYNDFAVGAYLYGGGKGAAYVFTGRATWPSTPARDRSPAVGCPWP